MLIGYGPGSKVVTTIPIISQESEFGSQERFRLKFMLPNDKMWRFGNPKKKTAVCMVSGFCRMDDKGKPEEASF
jgi:hypothetical protein